MHKFWYHSPVRFYKTKEELSDMTNPQNTQFFGAKNPYPLELGVYHRFLIPNFNNEISASELRLYLVNEYETLITSKIDVVDNKLCAVTFKHDEITQGTFEIRDDYETLFYSNCIRFMDSTDSDGRKFIRIITKHLYDKNLFPYSKNTNFYTVTNLPAYCLGRFSADVDVKNSRVGNSASLITSETYTDEVVSYDFLINGDANLLTYIQVNAVNNEFYIDGTQRTALEKIDVDDFAMVGKMKFASVKDKNGLNVTIDEDDVFSDLELNIIDKSLPDDFIEEASAFDGILYLTFNAEVFKTFGYGLTKKIKIWRKPLSGSTYTVYQEFNVNQVSIVNNQVFITPLGTVFDTGYYYITVDADMFKNSVGNTFQGISNTTDWNFSLLDSITPSINISWEDGTNTDISSYDGTYIVKILNQVTSPSNPIISYSWEKSTDNIIFTPFASGSDNKLVNMVNGTNFIRLKITLQDTTEVYSNVLTYIRLTYPVSNYYYKAIRPYDYPGNDYVRYKDENDNEQIQVLIRSHWEDLNNDGIQQSYEWLIAPCTLIQAKEILEVVGAEVCTP